MITMLTVDSAVKKQYKTKHRQCPCSCGVYILVLRERPSINMYVISDDYECFGKKRVREIWTPGDLFYIGWSRKASLPSNVTQSFVN